MLFVRRDSVRTGSVLLIVIYNTVSLPVALIGTLWINWPSRGRGRKGGSWITRGHRAGPHVAGWGRLRALSWKMWRPIASPVWGRRRRVLFTFFIFRSTLRNLNMDALVLKLSVIQSFNGIHGLIVVGHVHKSKILDNSTLCNRTILFKQSAQLFIGSLLYISYVQFDWALVLPVTRLHVDRRAVELVKMEVPDGLGGVLTVIHVNEGEVFYDGALGDLAVFFKELLDLILRGFSGKVPHKNLHHC